MSSLCSCPGVRRWTWGSKKAGNACRPAASTTSAPSTSARARRGELGDPAVADDDVVGALDPGDRVEQRRFAQDHVRALAGAHVERLGEAHAGCPCPIGVGSSAAGSGPPEAGSDRLPVVASSS